MEQVEANEKVRIIGLGSYPKCLQGHFFAILSFIFKRIHYPIKEANNLNYLVGPQFVQYGLKAIYLTLSLLLTLLFTLPVPGHVLVQNPPSIPTLIVVYFYTLLTSSRFIIDWHNYGFTILALKSGPQHFLVKLCKRFYFLNFQSNNQSYF